MNKTVLITGGAKGIGAATARVFASQKYNIIINYHSSSQKAQELAQELIDKYAIKAYAIQADISNEKEVQNLFHKIQKMGLNVDILINNAATYKDNFISAKNASEFNQVLQTNVTGTYLMCKYFGYPMKDAHYGKIINISSTNAIDTYAPYSIDYDASKAGIISLTHNFAVELAPYVNVNAIAPGWTSTESVKKMNPSIIESETQKILLKRFADPEEIANVIYFLASDKASYINSAIIRVDGGWYI